MIKASSQETDPNAEICMYSVLCNISKVARQAELGEWEFKPQSWKLWKENDLSGLSQVFP